jgi:hypothetical protein
MQGFAFGFCLWLLLWAFGLWALGFWLLAFWLWEAFGREDCWREIAEGGKRIAEGELLKGNC